MRGNTHFFTAAIILLVLGSPVFAYRQVIDLGTLGGTQSSALSINDKGQIVGYAYNSAGQYRACLFDPTGGGANISLGVLNGNSNSAAISINNNGMIVGNSFDNAGISHACLFDSSGNGANIDLKSLSSLYPKSGALSINDSGVVVGYALDKYGKTCAAIFDNTGGGANKDLSIHIPYKGYTGYAFSINDAGKVVGSAYLTHSMHACIFDETGGGNYIDLGKSDIYGSYAECINNNDQIVGYVLDSYVNGRACIFDPTGGGANIFLGALGGGDSIANFINDNGQIVGWAATSNNVTLHACLFDPTGGGNNIDLNTLIDQSSGWTLQYAYCINDSGWIVGSGVYDGYERAFLLTPEPATLLLFGLGVSFLRRRK